MTVISREEARNGKMIIEYTKELEKLPRGKITPKPSMAKPIITCITVTGKR